MRREFYEETGLRVDRWEHFARIASPEVEIDCFCATSPDYQAVRAETDEHVEIHQVLALFGDGGDMLSNVRWLLTMALPEQSGDWPFDVRLKPTPALQPQWMDAGQLSMF
jgi:8-oxo-dGTP pyrophosphatase MutT (NUDIX family)